VSIQESFVAKKKTAAPYSTVAIDIYFLLKDFSNRGLDCDTVTVSALVGAGSREEANDRCRSQHRFLVLSYIPICLLNRFLSTEWLAKVDWLSRNKAGCLASMKRGWYGCCTVTGWWRLPPTRRSLRHSLVRARRFAGRLHIDDR
jgi:hypothetical protein